MKKLFTILAAVLLNASVFAQSPEKMSYQAVIRNSSDSLVTNTQIGMQISILQDSIYGAAVYAETQTPTTNANGLVSIEIGAGTVLYGDFTTIDWANGPYFVKTETDPDGATGGIVYTITGTSQLLSVPYALFSQNTAPRILNLFDVDLTYINESVSLSSGMIGYSIEFSSNKDPKLITPRFIGDIFLNGIQITPMMVSNDSQLGNNIYSLWMMFDGNSTTVQNGDILNFNIYFLDSFFDIVSLTHSYTITGL